MGNILVLKQSFPPFVDSRARILILGTLPGEESLRLQRYYGNPRNLFWRVLADVFAEPYVIEYEQQKAMLRRNRIALWDVLHSAERIGSLDSAIKNPVPNDIAKLLDGLSAPAHDRVQRPARANAVPPVHRGDSHDPAREIAHRGFALDEPDAGPQACQLSGEGGALVRVPERGRPGREG